MNEFRLRRWSLDDGPGWGWVGGYLVLAWGILQVTETVGSLLGLPLWFGRALLALLALGLVAVVVTALVHVGGGAGPAATTPWPRIRGLMTWRRVAIAGAAAFVLLAVGTAGHLSARALGVGSAGTMIARGLLPEDAELVLAELEDHTGEPEVARATTEALRVHLSQSPTIRLASTTRVREALTRMTVPAGAPLDMSTARELAVREGLKAVVGGEIHRVGSRYTVSARLVAAESGTELVAAIETADEPDELIPAVERLSQRLRERIGESLRSIRSSPPLGRVRTASLPALKSYTEGIDANLRGDFERCALLMNDAIALDSTFAMAYEGRAACDQNLGRNTARQIADRTRAYEMRDRMTEEERLRITAIYHHYVAPDPRRAIEAWEAYALRYPDRAAPLFNLANVLADQREWARAEQVLLRGLALSPKTTAVLINLAGYQMNQGRFADARATFLRLEQAVPEIDIAWRKAALHLAEADWDAAAAELAVARDRARGNPGLRSTVAALQALLAQTRGRYAEAERVLRDIIADDLRSGEMVRYHAHALSLAELHLRAFGDSAGALTIVEGALATVPLDSLDVLDRGYARAAMVFAEAGAVARARDMIAEYERLVIPLRPGSAVPHRVRAAIATAEGRFDDALAAWRLEDESEEDPLPPLARIADLYDRMGQPDSAIVYYHRFLGTPSRSRYDSDADWRARAFERLGQLHEARGENAAAADAYADLVELWSDADPSLRPRVEHARARVRTLTMDRG